MKTEIPEFLIEMSKQMKEQDNRITADPIWTVCYDEWLTCADGRGDKTIVLVTSDDEFDEFEFEEFQEYIDEKHKEDENLFKKLLDDNEIEKPSDYIEDLFDVKLYSDDFPFEVEVVEMQKTRKTIKSCLTESDANAFIKRKQHDYPKLYTYVESMVFCPQMIELRNWIKGLGD
jgi:replicative superfamily II helicase